MESSAWVNRPELDIETHNKLLIARVIGLEKLLAEATQRARKYERALSLISVENTRIGENVSVTPAEFAKRALEGRS